LLILIVCGRVDTPGIVHSGELLLSISFIADS
jgi:hypothetical protein